MCVKNNTVCSWWEIDSLNCLPGSNPAQVDVLTSRLSARHAAGEKLIPLIFLPARTRHEWTYLGSNTPPRSYKHKSGNHENYSSILNGTVLITVRNAIAARSCLHRRLWFCSQGEGVVDTPRADCPWADTPPPHRWLPECILVSF